MAIWLHGYLAVGPWHGMAVYGHMAIWPCRFDMVRLYMATWLHGYMAERPWHGMAVYGFMAVWPYACLATA